jgi:hypothetical protein
MRRFTLLLLPIILTGCTYSVTLAHTEGTASDLIDEEQTTSPDVRPTVTLPLTNPLL